MLAAAIANGRLLFFKRLLILFTLRLQRHGATTRDAAFDRVRSGIGTVKYCSLFRIHTFVHYLLLLLMVVVVVVVLLLLLRIWW
jgi:hypothetical protein